MNKNDFHITSNTQKSYYRLWVMFFNHYVNTKLPRKKTLYGFNTKPAHIQLQYLEKYIDERKFKVENANIYDNQTGDWLKTFDKKTFSWRETTADEKQLAIAKNYKYVAKR